MQTLKISQLEPGMIIAKSVKSNCGQLIVKQGTTLTNQIIARIQFYGVNRVDVEAEDKTEAAVEEAPIPKEIFDDELKKRNWQPSYSQRVKSSHQFMSFQIDYTRISTELNHSFDAFMENPSSEEFEALKESLLTLLHSTGNSIELFDMLHNMRTDEDSIYAHSINVALIASAFGRWLKLPDAEIRLLMQAGLLHDIGKTKIPPELLNKPGIYTEVEFARVKQHPILGYHLMLKLPELDPRIAECVLMHHERCDGSGYPQGLHNGQISDFAKIIAIADVYDAMTAARSYRSPLCPFQAIAAFENEGLQKYDPKYILVFLEHIVNTYQSNRVMLSNGLGANIVMLNRHMLSRPIVQLADGSCLDLAQKKDIHILSLL